ncbi:hypothetical protein FRC03_008039 [Tulasnella sp. 419]|nr:hypothetical protein FRC02_005802 [Tulasnella sp. 418]KAG8959390.1 hypothetical protein FRC03_008039 [Tulasnella sp. 419]
MSDKQNYIVVFKAHATPEQVEQHANEVQNNGGEVGHRYESVLKGFSAKLDPNYASNLQGNDLIDYIEPDGVVTTQ